MSKILLKINIEDSRVSYKESFDGTATVHDLLRSISAKAGKERVSLYSGFPPSAIAYDSPSTPLLFVGLKSGCAVTVRDKPIIIRRVVAADNSCLFHAISYAIAHHRDSLPTSLRSAVSEAILMDPDTYSEALLGRPVEEYAQWIRQSSSWGGEIELGILAHHLNLEIAAVDVQTNNVYTYSPREPSERRIYVIYDGIHYDVLAYAKSEDADESADITIFRTTDSDALDECKAKALDLCRLRQFVDLGGFEITCMVCNQGFRGQREAAEHAKSTSHQNFTQK